MKPLVWGGNRPATWSQRMERFMTKQETCINVHTNVDQLTERELLEEAEQSKHRARVRLLNNIHSMPLNEELMDTAYAYDPNNDMSFTGEFEAISV